MALFDDLTLGRYLPGDSPVHRLDARLKLALVPFFIAASLSVGAPLPLGVLSLFALALGALSGIGAKTWWRGIWLFRWLFLFTVLLHLFFSPGRTLFGIAFLSRDGLAFGMIVVWQLALAVFFSSLLTLTASPERLACALTDLLSPLRRMGLPVKRAGEFFLLILSFLPIFGEELAALPERRVALAQKGFWARLTSLRLVLAPLLMRLIERAEVMAQALARGEALVSQTDAGAPSSPSAGLNIAFLALSTLVLAGVWIL